MVFTKTIKKDQRMRCLFIILLVIFTSCKSKTKEDQKVLDKATTTVTKIDFNLIDTVLKNLKIEKEDCKLDLIALKENPSNSKETIIAIPEIIKTDPEDDSYFEFDSHILIVDTKTGEIKQKYFESAKTNDWLSDAVMLTDIKIDTAPYLVSKNNRAFGIRVYYRNNSQPNPYSYETISLFLKTNNSLLKILNNYNVMEYHGESDTVCYGDFVGSKSVLIMTKDKTNGYFNILVKNKIIETKSRPDKNDDCIDSEVITTTKTTLKFNNKNYN